jgi:AcrR family transcriptional regulator
MTDHPRNLKTVKPRATPARIIDAALNLTQTCGVDDWTMRQLAAAVSVYPAVIYHHVGDRETVVVAVVERVATMIPTPLENQDRPWRQWLRQFADHVRAILSEYPGTARKVAGWATVETGPTHSLTRKLTRVLRSAGFGAESAALARFFLVTACLFVSMEDDRIRHRHPAWLVHMQGVQSYTYAIDRCLDGLAATLHGGEASARTAEL